MADNVYNPGWRNQEFVDDYRAAHPRVVRAQGDANNQIGVGNNANLARAFQNELRNYRAGLGDDLLVRRRRTAEQRQQARDAERAHMREALNIDDDEYYRQADLAHRLNQQQRRQVRQQAPRTLAQIRRHADRVMNPRIIEKTDYDDTLRSENIKGRLYDDMRSDYYNTFQGKTLSTIGPDSRAAIQRLFGELVGLLGFQPEFHRELLTKASAKTYLRDPDETKYRYELYDMDDDYRTPGTLWIYRREHDVNRRNRMGQMEVLHYPEEIHSIGGYVVSKSATQRTSIATLRDMDYYSTHHTSDLRKAENKRDWAIAHNYVAMKPVPQLFKEVSTVISVMLETEKHRKIPTVGSASYIVFHDTVTREPLLDVVAKISTITWNAILSRVTELFLMYYVYPQINLNAVGNDGQPLFSERFRRQFAAVRLPLTPNNQIAEFRNDRPNNHINLKEYLYTIWKEAVIHPEVEKKLLNNQNLRNAITAIVDAFNFDTADSYLDNDYMEGNTSRVLDALTSTAILYFTNNPVKYMNEKLGLDAGNEDTFIISNLIFRLATEEEVNRINAGIEAGDIIEYGLTSKATDKVYKEQIVRVRGNEFVEDPEKRLNYGQLANLNAPYAGGDIGPGPDDDDDDDGDNGSSRPSGSSSGSSSFFEGTPARRMRTLSHTPRTGNRSQKTQNRLAQQQSRTTAIDRRRRVPGDVLSTPMTPRASVASSSSSSMPLYDPASMSSMFESEE